MSLKVANVNIYICNVNELGLQFSGVDVSAGLTMVWVVHLNRGL